MVKYLVMLVLFVACIAKFSGKIFSHTPKLYDRVHHVVTCIHNFKAYMSMNYRNKRLPRNDAAKFLPFSFFVLFCSLIIF